MRSRPLLALLMCALLTAPALAQETDPQRRPENAVAGLDAAQGLQVQLFASEPMLVNPTNIAVDARGRVWVAEGYNYRMQLNPQNPSKEEGDRILILEDTDADGQADKQTVFYQGTDINAALGVFVMGDRVYVSAAPNLFIFTDSNGDDRPDAKEILFTGISGEQNDHGLHAVTLGPDGKLYFNYGNEGKQLLDRSGKPVVDRAGNVVAADGDPYREGMVFRMNPDGSDFEVLGHNFRNPYEVAVDSYGTLWQSDNDDDGSRAVRINYVMESGNFGYKDEMTGASWWISRTNLEEDTPRRHWHLNDPGVVPNLLQTGAGSPTGMVIYEGRLLPERFRNAIIHADAGPNVVRAYPVQTSGAGYAARIENIVQGTRDQWFRPSDVAVAPDGSLFIADWYDAGVGGHQVADLGRGRIFRVAPPGAADYRVNPPDVSTTAGAIEALKSPNIATRHLGWTALHNRGRAAEGALKAVFERDPDPRFRARALWLLTKIPGRGGYWVERALRDPNPDLRITGLRAARQLDTDITPHIKLAVEDADPQVRREAALVLRHKPSPEAARLWTDLAVQHDGQDRWYLEALGIGADRQWDAFFSEWKRRVGDGWNTPAGRDIIWRSRSAAAIPLLARIITDPNTTPQERLRYFRAFDFHTDPSKQDILIALLDGDHPDQPQITALALQHMDGMRAKYNREVQTALRQTLLLTAGTPQFVELVQRFGLTDRNEELLEIALANTNQDHGVDAARLILKNGGMPLFERVLDTGTDEQVSAALSLLADVELQEATALIRRVMLDEGRRPAHRRAAVQAYGRGWGGEERLLAAVKAGEIPDDLKPTVGAVLFNAYRQGIRQEAAEYLQPPAASNRTLPTVHELVARAGDARNGEAVFAAVCASCHVAGGQGVNFGPALSEIGSKLPKEALYTSILHPDAGISFGYEGYQVTMKDGTMAVGIIASETADAIEVRTPGGLTTHYQKAEITSRTPLEHSLMPHGLEQAMSEQDLVDLVEYLAALKRKE